MIVKLRGCEGCTSVAGFPGSWWASLMSIPLINGSFLPPWVAKMAAMSFLPSAEHVCKISCLLNQWCLWCCLGALPSVLRLGNYKACRPARCSPEASFMSSSGHLQIAQAHHCHPQLIQRRMWFCKLQWRQGGFKVDMHLSSVNVSISQYVRRNCQLSWIHGDLLSSDNFSPRNNKPVLRLLSSFVVLLDHSCRVSSKGFSHWFSHFIEIWVES